LPRGGGCGITIRVTPFDIVLLSGIICWGTPCLTYGLAKRSWVGVFTAGLILTLLFSVLAIPFPRFAEVAAITVNGAALLFFVVGIVLNVLSIWRFGRRHHDYHPQQSTGRPE
jgi:Co/Zn/Cd efflux system component